ncbi:TPA: tail fiber protein [Escherichia coli]|nr:phage tail protein [Escherichia coli]
MGDTNQPISPVQASSLATVPDISDFPLVADVQYREPYVSSSLNRKFRGIVMKGFYNGFYPVPGPGLSIDVIPGDDGYGTASNTFGEYQITVQQRKTVNVPLVAGITQIVVLQTTYALGQETNQVNTKSAVKAAEIKVVSEVGPNQLEICRVNIPADATKITADMINMSFRLVVRLGVKLSSSIDSTREDVAATSYAIKLVHDKIATAINNFENHTHPWSQITDIPEASVSQMGIVRLNGSVASTSMTMAATSYAVKQAYDLAKGKADESHTHPWSQITSIPDATVSQKGIVKLSNSTSDTSTTLAATANAVKVVNDNANKKVPLGCSGNYSAPTNVPWNAPTGLYTGDLSGSSCLIAHFNSGTGSCPAFQLRVDYKNGGISYRSARDNYGFEKGFEPLIPLSNTIDSSMNQATTPKAVLESLKNRAIASSGWVNIGEKEGNWSTSDFLTWLEGAGAFSVPYWMCRGSWAYANNKIITDTKCGNIHLAGCIVEVMGRNKDAVTIRITTPTTSTANGTINAEFIYVSNGGNYNPGWRRTFNTSSMMDEIYPIGSPIPWPSDTIPAGYTAMVGQTFNKTTYPKLAIAYPSGVIPDMRGWTIKGKPGSGRAILTTENDGNKSHNHTASAGSSDLGTKATTSTDLGTRASTSTDLGTKGTTTFNHGNKNTSHTGNHSHGYITAQGGGANRGSFDGDGDSIRTLQTDSTGAHTHSVAIGTHSHSVVLGAHTHNTVMGSHGHSIVMGAHGHVVTINAAGNPETTVKNIAFNYIVRLA